MRYVVVMLVALACAGCVSPVGPPISTPEKCMWWTFEHTTYEDDFEAYGHEYWQTPEETLALGTGDCEDFALLCMWKMRQCGLDSAFACIAARNGTFHAIVLCEGGLFDPCTPRATYDPGDVLYSLPYDIVMYIAETTHGFDPSGIFTGSTARN